jgi:hypothetical protein
VVRSDSLPQDRVYSIGPDADRPGGQGSLGKGHGGPPEQMEGGLFRYGDYSLRTTPPPAVADTQDGTLARHCGRAVQPHYPSSTSAKPEGGRPAAL